MAGKYVVIGTDTRGEYVDPVFYVEVFDSLTAAQDDLWKRLHEEIASQPYMGMDVMFWDKVVGDAAELAEHGELERPECIPARVSLRSIEGDAITYRIKEA